MREKSVTLGRLDYEIAYHRLPLFARFAWFVLVYNLLVILWRAYVRATGSGAGCGSHWPLCNGEVLPRSLQIETLIEFTHRLSSGLAFLLVMGLLHWAWRAYPKGHLVRVGALLSGFFIVTEALIGAGLVLFEWVASDASLGRAISIVVHLLSTFMLLGSLVLRAWWASGGNEFKTPGQNKLVVIGSLGLMGTLAIGASGALAALGDTLFPAPSLAEGLVQDISPTAHFLLRLRLLHPTLAGVVGGYLILAAGYIRLWHRQPRTRSLAYWLTLIILTQLGAGLLNLILLAPLWMQLVHLLLADLVWIMLILVLISALEDQHLLEAGRR